MSNTMFSNGNGNNLIFAKFNGKEGVFIVTDKATKEKTAFSQMRDVVLQGLVMGEDSYEGNPFSVLSLDLKGPEGVARVRFAGGSSSTAGLLARLLKTDLKAPFGLKGQLLKAGSVVKGFGDQPLKGDVVSVSVYQGTSWIQVSEADRPPKAVMVKVGRQEIADTTAREEFIAAAVAKLQASLEMAPEQATPPVEAYAGDDFACLDEDVPF